jgi:hypothetical protein
MAKSAKKKPAPAKPAARPDPLHRSAVHSRPDVHGSAPARPRNEVPGARPAAARFAGAPQNVAQPKGGIRVQATQTGYYDDARRRPGDVFTIRSEQQFSKKWMVKVAAGTREKTTTGRQALQQHHDAENRARLGIDADIDNPDGSEGVLGAD